MASMRGSSPAGRGGGGGGGQALRQLVQGLRGDLNVLSNEARKKYPAVRESAERGAMRLKTLSESKGFTIEVLAATDDVVHPLLFACETKNPTIVRTALSSLQKLIQYKAVPQKSVDGIVATLRLLVEAGMEELKVLQTILLLVTATDVVQGKSLSKVLVLCFKLYGMREPSVHNTAGVAIRQIVSAMFERLNRFMCEAGEGGEGGEGGEQVESHQQLPVQAKDAYLLFQDVCFLTNGDPPAWLPSSLDLDPSLGLELLESTLREFPRIFTSEKLFNQLLTERVCPLVIKLFSPTTKYRHAPSSAPSAVLATDRPTFALCVRLLRILSVLIREFYVCLITQCEIFLSMLVRFLDSDKPLWQRTLAVEVLYSFSNQPLLLKSFCQSYDMQEHSSKIFGDIVDALGGFIQSNLTTHLTHVNAATSSSSVTNNSSTGHMTSNQSASSQRVHLFSIKNTILQAESLATSSHTKPTYLEMLDKTEVPVIQEGYPLVVAMMALLDAIQSVSLVVNDDGSLSKATPPPPLLSSPKRAVSSEEVKTVMLSSSWSGVLAALALLLDACADERTTRQVLSSHLAFTQLCGRLSMLAPRDAFLTSLCKAALPPRYAMSLIAQRPSSSSSPATGQQGLEHTDGNTSSDAVARLPAARRKLSLNVADGVSGGGVEGVRGGAVTSVSSGGGTPVLTHRLSGGVSSGGGTPVLTHRLSGGVSGGGVGTPVREQPSGLVTLKNLQCIDTLLEVVSRHGNVLDSAWLLVFTAVQHIFEVFGLSAVVGGGFKQSGIAENSSLALVVVEKRATIVDLTQRLQEVFKSTRKLSDASLLDLVEALALLSANSTQTARDIRLFPVSALLEVVLCNQPSRLRLVWKPITNHLTKMCCHSDAVLRCFAADDLTALIRLTLEGETQEESMALLLFPLLSLSSVQHADVRLKQMDCVSHVLHSTGQMLGANWSVVLEVINSATTLQSEALVRAAFQSLQLVIADFLPALPPLCVPVCVEVAGQFGLQTQDINISLTSIGLLWNIADCLYQNKAGLHSSLEGLKQQLLLRHTRQTSPGTSQTGSQSMMSAFFVTLLQKSSLPVFDCVWLLLFKHLSELCVDERAAVRKSASQTLFSTLSAHGTLLQSAAWDHVLWQVLFPLLERVNQATGAASTSSMPTAILIHHSRNTQHKQWAETQVLTLIGTARLFQSRWSSLVTLDSFEKAWTTFLLSLKSAACSGNSEVSIAAIKSFHTMVDPKATHRVSTGELPNKASLEAPPLGNAPSDESLASARAEIPDALATVIWTRSWQAWETIGVECVCRRLPSVERLKALIKSQKPQEVDAFTQVLPSQAFLVQLLKIFPLIFVKLKARFSETNFKTLAQILRAALLQPVAKDVSPFLVPSSNEHSMTVLQRLVIQCLAAFYTETTLFQESTQNGEPLSLLSRKAEVIDMDRKIKLSFTPELQCLSSHILAELLGYTTFATNPPELVQLTAGVVSTKLPVMSVNYVPFGLGALSVCVQFYRACVQEGMALPQNVPEQFLKALHVPLRQKYGYPQAIVWTQALDALLLVLETALPHTLQQGETSLPFWRELAAILEDFLFTHIPKGVELSVAKQREYEALDIEVIEMVKRDIISVSAHTPDEFLRRLTGILNRGSIHSATDHCDGEGPQPTAAAPFRENFARVCFEALLKFSFLHSKGSTTDPASQLALNALLQRCQEVLLKFVSDEKLSGSCPLPRARMGEVALVLKSVTVLVSSLKEARKTSSATIDDSVWLQVSKLYPALVQCVTCSSGDVRSALKDTLLQFTDLIVPL